MTSVDNDHMTASERVFDTTRDASALIREAVGVPDTTPVIFSDNVPEGVAYLVPSEWLKP